MDEDSLTMNLRSHLVDVHQWGAEAPVTRTMETEERHTQEKPHLNEDLAFGAARVVENPQDELAYGVEAHRGKHRKEEERAGTGGERVHISVRCPVCNQRFVSLDEVDISNDLRNHMTMRHDLVPRARAL